MVEYAVEAVGPHGAVGTAGAHVVDQDQVGLVAEQLGEVDRPIRPAELVVLHRLGRHTAANFLESLLRLFQVGPGRGKFFL